MKHRICISYLLHIILILLLSISNAKSQLNINIDNGNLDGWILTDKETVTDPSNWFFSSGIAQSDSLFRIVLLPDTQIYTKHFPHIFTAQTQWIADNHIDLNIKFVMHEGDIANSNTHTEWQLANTSMSLLDGVVPYSLLPGNHDMGPDGRGHERDTTLYNQYFPVSRYQNTSTFGGVFPTEPNRYDNNYHTFSAGGIDWLVLSLEFGPRDPVIDWANQVVINHPNHRVIVVTHTYLFHDNTRHSGQSWNPYVYHVSRGPGGVNDGEEMWNEFVKLHSNIRFVFSGHVLGDGLGRLVSYGDFGNPVFQLLTNYQMNPKGGEGYLRILEIDPIGNTFTAKAYSPYLDQYKTDSQNQYTYDNVDLMSPNGGGGPVISISDVSVTEGGSAVFSIMLSSAVSNNVVIDYQTVNGTAMSGSDYDSRSGRIVFSPGDTVKTRTVNILQDSLSEANEIFTMTLTNPVNATLGQSTGTATISDDDGDGQGTFCGEPSINTSEDRAIFLWNNCYGDGKWNIRATAGGGSATYNGNITTDQAFIHVTPFNIESSDTLSFGAQSITFVMTMGGIWQDGFDFDVGSGNTCFNLNAPAGIDVLVGVSRTPVTPSFDFESLQACQTGGGGPVISISDVSVTEGGSAVFSIMLSSAASNNVVIDYQTVNGTAISGSDYDSHSGRIVFSPGDTVKTRTVNILQDSLSEANEIFTMTLTNPVNATLGQSTGTATISDDDGGGGPVISISDVSVTEGGSAVFSIMLSSAVSNNVVIDYQTVNGTAMSGSDYDSRSGRIVFSPGDTVKTRTVNILQDSLSEANEIFTMTLTNPVNATLGQSTGTATISDDD